MENHTKGDASMSLEELLAYHDHEKSTLFKLIQKLIRAKDGTIKARARKELVKNVLIIQSNTENILSQEILTLIEEENNRAVGILRRAKEVGIIKDIKDKITEQHYKYSDKIFNDFMKEYKKAFDSITTLASRFSTERRFKRYLNTLHGDEDVAKDKLIDSLSGGFITILGKETRKTRKYDLSYYSNLLISVIEPTVKSKVHIIRARENGLDLLRVTTQPSKLGDYCDAFRGKVFSISGGNRRFARLTDLPTDCPPFHPFCQHHLEIYFEELVSKEESDLAEGLDKKFLNKNHDELTKLWQARQLPT
jgi:hypothetical protein